MQDNYFRDYKIIVCAGTKAGIGLDALAPVQNAMGNPLATKTITLSCGKLTTGVTIKPWAGVFMLRNLKSPETYFQTAFRVQSPWTIKDDLGKEEIMKQEDELEELNRQLQKEQAKQRIIEPDLVRIFMRSIKIGSRDDLEYQKLLVNTLIDRIYLYDDHFSIFLNHSGRKGRVSNHEVADIEKYFSDNPNSSSITLDSGTPSSKAQNPLKRLRSSGFSFLIDACDTAPVLSIVLVHERSIRAE